MRITVFGLGEAGSLIAAELAGAGVEVHGFDPADVPTPPGIVRHADPRRAVGRSDLVMALTAARDAQTAIAQAWDQLRRGAVYADLSTAPASLKEDLNDTAALRGLVFADVALMASVPGRGLATPSLASGVGADRYAEAINALGGAVEVISKDPGDAATRKLLRSVFMKGLIGVLIEALRGADAAGHGEWLRTHLIEVVDSADRSMLERMLDGTATHAERRREEMEHAATLLVQLGVEPIMTTGTVESLRSAPDLGVPPIDPA